jgi:hypothetical protein
VFLMFCFYSITVFLIMAQFGAEGVKNGANG